MVRLRTAFVIIVGGLVTAATNATVLAQDVIRPEVAWVGAAEGAITEQALRQLERAAAFNLDQTLRAWERGYIEAALRLTRGNVSQAAKLLGINRTTLYSRMSSAEEK